MKTASRLALSAALATLAALPVSADDPPVCPAIDPPALLRQVADAPKPLWRRRGFGDQAAPLLGLRAFRDPITGELRKPTAEEAAAIARAEAEAAPERQPVFEVVVHPDGMKTVDLQGAFTSAAIAKRNPDGSIAICCVPASAAPAPGPPRPALEEK